MQQKYYFVGIKGSGMSSLAQLLHDNGYLVEGSDKEEYFFTQKGLEERNIPLYVFNEKNLTEENVYIIGNAYNEKNNSEVKTIKENKLTYYTYHDFLGKFAEKFTSIAITGTHGKTTTTGLMYQSIKETVLANCLIGDGTGMAMENASHFVFEACEYKRHFLSYKPDYAIVTNVEFDHPDYFKDEKDVLHAFEEFLKQVKKGIVVCGDDENARKLNKSDKTVVYYGLKHKNNDIYAENIQVSEQGTEFDVYYKNQFLTRVLIPLFGQHQILNTLAVIGIAILENLNIEEIKIQLMQFKGVKRRFSETNYTTNVIVDDYAHHPTEIKATIETAKLKYPNKKIITIFQPHTFSRTEALLDEFSQSFQKADEIYLCDIFSSAREKEGEVSIEDLIKKTNKSRKFTSEILNRLKSEQNSVIMFMGAGNVNQYIKEFA